MCHGASVVAKKAATVCGPADDRKWQVEDALRTLNRAEEIRKDKRMMSDVKRLATEQIKTLSNHVMNRDADDKKRAKKPANALMKR